MAGLAKDVNKKDIIDDVKFNFTLNAMDMKQIVENERKETLVSATVQRDTAVLSTELGEGQTIKVFDNVKHEASKEDEEIEQR